MSKIDGGLRSEFRKHLPQFDWVSIESNTGVRGIPDSNYCRNGIEGWIEYKTTSGWAVTLAPEQIGWIARRVRCGGRVWIAVRRRHAGGPRLGPPVDELWLLPGELAVQARTGGLRPLSGHPRVASYAGGPSRWNWAAVAARLVI